MSAPAPDPRLSVRVATLEAELEATRRILQRVGALSRRTIARDVRIAKTVRDPSSNSYPTAGQTFWVEFLDSHYVASQGDQTPTHTPRASKAIAHNIRDAFLAEGTIVLATWQRGLGQSNAGEWWIDLIGGTMPAFSATSISARSSTTAGSGEAWLYHLVGTTLTSLGAKVDVSSCYGSDVPSGTWITIGQDTAGQWWLVGADCP